MKDDELYAKGQRTGGPNPPTVQEHCRDVAEIAATVLEASGDALESARCEGVNFLAERLRPLLLSAAWLHDMMKANSSFQEMLRTGADRKTQPIRHEILAAIQILYNETLANWLRTSLSREKLQMVAWTVASHHLQARLKRQTDRDDPLFRTSNIPRQVTLFLDHPQVSAILQNIDQVLNGDGAETAPKRLPAPPAYDTLDEDDPDGLAALVRRFVAESDQAWRRWQRDDLRIDLGLLKALLIAADIAGSALPGQIKQPHDWIRDRLGNGLSADELNRVVQDNLNGRALRRFQQNVQASEHRVTVVTAGCGNGKTTAAYLWAQRHAVGRKLFFTYPTTGTASAGFRDYLFAQSELERDLIHSRSEVDLEAMWETATDVPAIERVQRLEALNAWGQQVIACTADTVLGLIQNQRRPLFSFPAILRGAFVFDEVHSYDRRLFAALLKFLETFPGLPVLIMSASIPPGRMKALRGVCGERIIPEPICGDRTLEQVKRYTLHHSTEEECWSHVEDFLKSDSGRQAGKVLWVCNTVGTAVKTYHAAKERFPDAQILLYHSRYRYRDRVGLQERVVYEFAYVDSEKTTRRHSRPLIVITTQVCEMSLDISADLLVTALCPMPSLVQRLGRLNRYTDQDRAFPAYVYPFSGRPYHEEDAPAYCEAASRLINDLAGQPCSQQRLSEAIDQLQSQEELPKYSAWLDGGWQTEPMPVREGDNSLTLVREEDLRELSVDQYGNYRKDEVIRLTIPMLFQGGFDFTTRAAGYPVAASDTVDYDWDCSTKQGGGASWRRSM